jgi:RNA polymerase sigma-70 factor (ECF subfamily)
MVLRRALRFFDRAAAEDVASDVFMRVIENIDSFRAASSPATWLYRITTNICINRLRDEKRRRELWREHAPSLVLPPTPTAQPETVAFLRQLWQSLDPELVVIAVHYFADGMTHAEIARLVGCSRRTGGNRLDELRALARKAQDTPAPIEEVVS